MKVTSLLPFLALAARGSCCGGHDDKEWTKEELAELEEKWGHEVSFLTPVFMMDEGEK
jgi:agmatinase